MNDRKIDEVLHGATLPQGPKEETVGRIVESIAGSMRPVRPAPPRWVLTGGCVAICAAVMSVGAAWLGFFGIAKMGLLERTVVFSALGILVLLASGELASAMIPGSLRRLSSRRLAALSGLILATVFAACFREYHTTHFLHAGLTCLSVGGLHAIAAGALTWLVLRRGFAVDAVSAGLATGTLAGLAGVGMLELHCSNFQAAHVLIWHLSVLFASAALGGLGGWGATLVRSRPATTRTTASIQGNR